MLKFSTEEFVDVLNDNNEVFRSVPRSQSYAQKLPHQIVHVLVFDGTKLLVVRRSLSVRYLPGFYCTSAGGHVSSGESVESAAEREMFEEIGLKGPINFVETFDFHHDFRVRVSLYIKYLDLSVEALTLNPLEAAEGFFLSEKEFEDLDILHCHPQLHLCARKAFDHIKERSK
ncbi:MAG: NUDIX domain-containing protein [Proteobacteria bacterium]|nr:MAG: NUDIX domain-containing protein [Pseudomonadota bacterium]